MSSIDATLWILAEDYKAWACSQIQTFLYNRPDGDVSGKVGRIVVRDCRVSNGSQVIFSQECGEASYDWVSLEARKVVRQYQLKIVEQEYLHLLKEREQ